MPDAWYSLQPSWGRQLPREGQPVLLTGQALEASTWPAGCPLFLPQHPVRPPTA